MGRKNTIARKRIQQLCRLQQVEEAVLYARAKLILSIYRDVCWSTIGRADELREDLVCYCGGQLDDALIYLENFAPDEAKERFEERVRSLFETKWMVELVENAMMRLHEYPEQGALYAEIVSKCYLTAFHYSESELLELLGMERSCFYDRKKEAILVFGLSLWGNAIPKLKGFLLESDIYPSIQINVEETLDEADRLADRDMRRYTHEEVFGNLRNKSDLCPTKFG